MDWLADTGLQTAEAVVLDGANAVTSEPRQHFPHAGLSAGLAGAVLLLTVLWLRTARSRAPIAIALLLLAVPGTLALLAFRADAPLQRGALAATVTSALGELQAQTRWPDPHLKVVHEDDDVLFPLTRYAAPTRPEPTPPLRQLETWGGSLQARCVAAPDPTRVVCGAPP